LGPFNFTRVWTNDNLEYRSVLASSAAILARLPVKLGTAVADSAIALHAVPKY
jgi:hypothetical protein